MQEEEQGGGVKEGHTALPLPAKDLLLQLLLQFQHQPGLHLVSPGVQETERHLEEVSLRGHPVEDGDLSPVVAEAGLDDTAARVSGLEHVDPLVAAEAEELGVVVVRSPLVGSYYY